MRATCNAGFVRVQGYKVLVQRSSACFLPAYTCCINMRSYKGDLCKASSSLTEVANKTNKEHFKVKKVSLPSRRSLTIWVSYCCESSALWSSYEVRYDAWVLFWGPPQAGQPYFPYFLRFCVYLFRGFCSMESPQTFVFLGREGPYIRAKSVLFDMFLCFACYHLGTLF